MTLLSYTDADGSISRTGYDLLIGSNAGQPRVVRGGVELRLPREGGVMDLPDVEVLPFVVLSDGPRVLATRSLPWFGVTARDTLATSTEPTAVPPVELEALSEEVERIVAGVTASCPVISHPDLLPRVMALLAKHDPGRILVENPDAPADEYQGEAEEILWQLQGRACSERRTLAVVGKVFIEALGWRQVSLRRLWTAGRELHHLLRRETESP